MIFIFFSLLVLVFSSFVSANEIQNLEPVVVTSPLQDSPKAMGSLLSSLSGENLTLKQATTLGGTLKQELGIHSMSFGSSVGQPVIRGQLGSRVKVLKNGMSSLDVSNISPDHANTTEAIFAERIDVLRGPASLLYGSGVIGGIVNVIDNRIPMYIPEQLKTTFEQRFNSVSNQWSSALKHEGSLGDFAWHIDGFFRENQNYQVPVTANALGYVENSDAKSWSGTLGGSWLGDDAMLGFSVNYLDNKYGVPPVNELVRIDLQQARYDLKAEVYDLFSWVEKIKIDFSYNDYQHVELEEGVIVGTQFDNQGFEGRAEIVHKAIGFIDQGVFGFQGQSTQLTATGEEAFIPPSDVQNYALFMLEEVQTKNVTYELGLRIEPQQVDAEGFSVKQHTPVNVSLSALWNVMDDIFINMAFTHAQRAPNVQELFSDGVHFATQSYDLGNENLQLETSYNLELAFRADFDWLSTELNLFHNWSDNYILQKNTGHWFDLDNQNFVAACATSSSCLPVYETMQQSARFYGFEAQLDFPVWSGEDNKINFLLFSDYVRGELNAGGNVPRMPPLRYGFQANYSGYDAISSSLRLTRAEAQNYFGDNESKTEGYLLLDMNVNYKVRWAEKVDALFFIKANNLLNASIRNSTSMLREVAPEPGRGVELGVRVTF